MADNSNEGRPPVLPDSLIGLAANTLTPLERALGRIREATLIDLAGADIDPDRLDDARREEYAQLSALLVGFVQQGGKLLKEIVDAKAVDPARLAELVGAEAMSGFLNSDSEPLALEPGEPALVAEEVSGEDAVGRAAARNSAEPTIIRPPRPEKSKSRAELKPITVEMNGHVFDAQGLGLTSPRQVEVLELLPDFGEDPATVQGFIDKGFHGKASNRNTRQVALSTSLRSLTVLLERVAAEPVLDKRQERIAAPAEYFVLVPMTVNGKEVQVSVKKN